VDQLGQRLVLVEARTESDFEPAFAMLAKHGARGLIVCEEPFLNSRADQLAAMRYATLCLLSTQYAISRWLVV
jgi:hypothetical protein